MEALKTPVPEDPKWEADVRLQLDAEDTRTLDTACRVEKLPRTEILRRALRQYARSIGAEPEPETAPAPAPAPAPAAQDAEPAA